MSKEKELIAIGYRELKPGIWGKPIAFHLFVYNLQTDIWSNHFISNEGKPYVWETSNFNDINYEEFSVNILVCEKYTKITAGDWKHPLHFLTLKEQYEQ